MLEGGGILKGLCEEAFLVNLFIGNCVKNKINKICL